MQYRGERIRPIERCRSKTTPAAPRPVRAAARHPGLHRTSRTPTALESRMEARISSLEARMYRALWIQGGAIVAIITALNLLA